MAGLVFWGRRGGTPSVPTGHLPRGAGEKIGSAVARASEVRLAVLPWRDWVVWAPCPRVKRGAGKHGASEGEGRG